MTSKQDLIQAIRQINHEIILTQNPRRPFDNAKTIELFTEEVIRLVHEYIDYE